MVYVPEGKVPSGRPPEESPALPLPSPSSRPRGAGFRRSCVERVRIVLVEPQEPMNLGAVARAMRNFGLSRLYVVNPRPGWARPGPRRPTGSPSTPRRCWRRPRWREASWRPFGGAARGGHHGPSPGGLPRPRRPGLGGGGPGGGLPGEVALVFGRETFGLTNEELELAHLIGYIPTAPEQPSLNLAQAVVVFAYELFKRQGKGVGLREGASPPRWRPSGLLPGPGAVHPGDRLHRRAPLPLRHAPPPADLPQGRPHPGEVQMLRGLLHQSRFAQRRKDDGA